MTELFPLTFYKGLKEHEMYAFSHVIGMSESELDSMSSTAIGLAEVST